MKTKRTPRTLSTHLNVRLGGYAASAAGLLTGAVSIGSSDAAVVFTTVNSLLTDITPNNGLATLHPVDLNSDGIIDFRLLTQAEIGTQDPTLAIVLAPPVGSVGIEGIFANTFNYAARLAAGTAIDGSAAFLTLAGSAGASMAYGGGYANSQWATEPGNTGYIGIRFPIGAGTHFGWARLTVLPNNDPVNPRAIFLHEFAYESTPGAAIAAGAIPEPSSLGMLALGGAGLAAHRRRRKLAA